MQRSASSDSQTLGSLTDAVAADYSCTRVRQQPFEIREATASVLGCLAMHTTAAPLV